MVVLSKIYTKTGDRGETGLGDGTRVSKADLRIAAYGTVDELNAVLGLARRALSRPAAATILAIQHDLFDVGADLCIPHTTASRRPRLRVTPRYAQRLERAIDALTARLTPLNSFVLPGGAAAACWLHLARTVCRRAEREAVALNRREPMNPEVIIYLNRLSDLLFVMARAANRMGRRDVLW
ncbi:MAG: cob(I)yrinic acid a,c-diamide adenosyltransferase, partial [Candidatus Omnitrophica bacterium]|nr:cob(I)yrinic acid a,c-diamide adenosyltransferase [Candidatus Omnitrophota bacterium]